jgi:hypothetical protein
MDLSLVVVAEPSEGDKTVHNFGLSMPNIEKAR